MYENSVVDEIKNRCDIVEVVGRHVPLKKTGINHKGVCPFHNEKTPSFVVSETRQTFNCFGCGARGDVISFVQMYHNLDFSEAIEKLAQEYGIEIKRSGYDGEAKKNAYYDLNRKAAAFFYKSFSQQANRGYDYMTGRGLDAAVLRKFGIGYADSEWDSLYRYFVSQGDDVGMLAELGLISQSKGKNFDKFRDRVIFPIINTRGKVVGFGGRILGDGVPKYLNSPESPVFLKKNNLYGLNLAREDINKEGYVILVEGYMDVISLYKHGVRNAVASLGTALTENQAALLKRFTANVVICYDSDSAGTAAALKGVDVLNAAGCRPKVMQVTDGKDPDEFIQRKGKPLFLELVQKAMPSAEFKIHLLKQRYSLDTTEGSIAFMREAVKVLKELSPVEADIYIRKLAKETHISEGAIRMEVTGEAVTVTQETQFSRPRRRENAEMEKEREEGTNLPVQKSFIRLMLMKSAYVPRIKEYEGIFDNHICARIYEQINSLYKDDEEIDRRKLEDGLEPGEIRFLQTVLDDVPLSEKDEVLFADCVAKIQARQRDKREREIIQRLALADDEEGDLETIEELTRELMELQREKQR